MSFLLTRKKKGEEFSNIGRKVTNQWLIPWPPAINSPYCDSGQQLALTLNPRIFSTISISINQKNQRGKRVDQEGKNPGNYFEIRTENINCPKNITESTSKRVSSWPGLNPSGSQQIDLSRECSISWLLHMT